MDDPEKQIPQVIHELTQTSPSQQHRAIETYFTPDAAFTHPFCRTGSFNGSRILIRGIYRWYKIMSPEIKLRVNSVAYDRTNLILYVNISQVFRVFVIPSFLYAPHANLTTVLHLTKRPAPTPMSSGDPPMLQNAHEYPSTTKYKYYIRSQNDLYQVSEFVRFLFPGGLLFVLIWQELATLVCMLGATLGWPVSWWEEYGADLHLDKEQVEKTVEARVEDVKAEFRRVEQKIEQAVDKVEEHTMPEDKWMERAVGEKEKRR